MSIIKVQHVKINNIKNVREGDIHIAVDFESYQAANVVGLYGQNGSGKTTVVNAFELLKTLLSGWVSTDSLPTNSKKVIHIDEKMAKLEFDFIVINEHGEFTVRYEVELQEGNGRLYPVMEKLTYRENAHGKRSKILVFKDHEHVQIRTDSLNNLPENLRIPVMVTNHLAQKEHRSFIFHQDLQPILKERLNDVEMLLIHNLAHDFNRDLHVINNENIALVMTKYIMPFSVYLDKKRGTIPYNLSEPALLSAPLFQTLVEVIGQTNKVLSTIIPGLEIEVRKMTEQMLDDGEMGIRFEFLSKRGDRVLPLRTESEGILKIIAVLSALIAVYNNPNACVVIDELDSGVFEYLLGELLTIIEENGKGQLIFTSHNLRILEVLSSKNLWFTTANENNRYIQLKGVKALNNTRDVYLRAIQLGGQDDEIYKETKTFHIKRAFRKAGKANE